MDQLHYDKCDRCDTRYWEHEGQRELIHLWIPGCYRGITEIQGRELIFLCKSCIRVMYAKDREATSNA